jgi:hypothetical protein
MHSGHCVGLLLYRTATQIFIEFGRLLYFHQGRRVPKGYSRKTWQFSDFGQAISSEQDKALGMGAACDISRLRRFSICAGVLKGSGQFCVSNGVTAP